MIPPSRSDDNRCDAGNVARPVDEILAILQDEYRRIVIDHCRAAVGESAELDELVERIGRDSDRVAEGDAWDNLAAELHHIHLPILAEQNVIEWDPRSGNVRYLVDEELEKWVGHIKAIDSE